jgi:hypothetical protein
LLTICDNDRGEITDLLADRLAVEAERDARRALTVALGRLGALGGDPRIPERLLAIAASASEASTSAAALVAVARINPAIVPLDGAAALVERAYAEPSDPTEQGDFATGTLIGQLRLMKAASVAGRRAPHAARLADELADALAPRVDDRIALLEDLLRSQHADVLGDALMGHTQAEGALELGLHRTGPSSSRPPPPPRQADPWLRRDRTFRRAVAGRTRRRHRGRGPSRAERASLARRPATVDRRQSVRRA